MDVAGRAGSDPARIDENVMRLFIGIELPENIREGLAEVERELGAVTNSARWVATESAHLTLKFLGEITEQRAEEVHQAMSVLTWKGFQITVKGIGFFPGTRSPRVFWAGVQAPTLEALTERIDSKLETFGFEKERRSYRAHITLARAKAGPLEAALVTAASQFKEREFGTFNVDRCFLYQSELTSNGPLYTKLKEYLLS
jgi:2'-5' RNA ligase